MPAIGHNGKVTPVWMNKDAVRVENVCCDLIGLSSDIGARAIGQCSLQQSHIPLQMVKQCAQ